MENTTKRNDKERMRLGYNEIMIVSKYFEYINDFINLEEREKKETNECKNIEYTQEDRNTYGTTIPIEVNSLGDICFRWCDDIQSINIPTNVSKIGDKYFEYCTSLRIINIPTNVSKIGDKYFERCSSLTSNSYKNIQFVGEDRIIVNEQIMASIPIGRLKIINEKEIKPKNINEFVIPTTVTKLGNYCFENCYSLTSIKIPTSVSEIGKECFL
ncbi:leucine rich repeat protein bspa family [Entamoeba histolytica]|uniref:Leucine rich repeat protein, BspA family n=2 Tax=Entamoeba histolytica TaxID=5759 RepID=C4M7I0_ENTH1|nr:uncharacterized protein EHI_112290 [Entamoeba histolytica HM-1:IMSS]EAL43892.2 leucine rich repeat protein, BspA family [Entamoeba histolytica HM-1:IMSS]GAT97492.1 leucine rich repeat protein bspa family [Entamoeba histolytica]|eukprot:XP_649281.2 uncharacterized protein EHI_112290 [Entamoeba histolytica HM-1:IMSS]